MTNRFKTALDIQDACNPSGVAYAFIYACREVRAEPGYTGTDMLCQDPALRMIAYKLSDLMNAGEIEKSFAEYDMVTRQCRKLAQDIELTE